MPLTADQLLERFNARQPATGLLFGMKVIEVEVNPPRVKIEYHPGESLTNPRGTVQGGILTAMLDDAAAVAGIVALGEPGFIATLELKTSFFAPAFAGLLYAEGRCLKMGRSSAFLEAEMRDSTGKLLAKMTTTVVPIRSDQKPKLVNV